MCRWFFLGLLLKELDEHRENFPLSVTLNGILAGLVGITAGCDAVSPAGAALIGAICGVVMIFSVDFIDKVLKIDDPVGASSVHGVCGFLGTILTGLFSTSEGLFYGYGFDSSVHKYSEHW